MFNKKGQAIAIMGFLLLGIVAVFIVQLTAVPVAKVWDDVSTELKGDDAFGTDNITVEKIEQVDSLIVPAFDQFILFGLIGIILTLIVLAVFSDSPGIFVIFVILGIIVAVIVVSQMVNVTDDALNDPILQSKKDEFTLSNSVTGVQLPIIVLLAGAIAVIIMLRKGGGGGA